MQGQTSEKKPEERKRVSKFSDSIPENTQLLKDFQDSFKEKAPTQFIRGGFIGANDNSIMQEKGQLYEMNSLQYNISNNFQTNLPMAFQNPNYLSTQFTNNINANNFNSSTEASSLDRNKQNDLEKRSLKGRSLIQEIITDNEIQMNLSGKDNEKNSNLYLCNLSPFITDEILTREFGVFGKIESIKIIPPKCETIKHFIAFINFASAESAENALISKQNKIILGQPVKIKYGKKLTPCQQPQTPINRQVIPDNIIQQIPNSTVNLTSGSQSLLNTTQNHIVDSHQKINSNSISKSQILMPSIQGNQTISNTAILQQPFVQPLVHPNSENNYIPQIPFQQPGIIHQNFPPYQYQTNYSPMYVPQINPAFLLHPQLLVYPPPKPNFPTHPMYAILHLYVKFPENNELRKKIDEISMIVFKEGYITEQTILQRERQNPEYGFMIYPNTEENNYYRWRVYSLFQGDSLTNWRKEPFQMNPGGIIWVPPIFDPIEAVNQQKKLESEKNEEALKKEKDSALINKIKENALESGSDEDSSDVENDEEEKEILSKYNQIGKIPLTIKKKEIFNEILKNINSTKKDIKIALIFCYENIKNAEEIMETIFKFLKESKNYNNKILYLYLISDLMYNCKNTNIFNSHCYKKEIELILPEIFEEFNQFYLSFEGRISAESLKDKVSNLIRIWKGWQIFEEEYYNGLELTLLKKKKKSDKENSHLNKTIKTELEQYEDELLEIITESPQDLKSKALAKGISIKGELSDIISKLVYLKEQTLITDYQTKEKKENEKNMANKFKEKICELDITIENLKIVLESMQKSYKKIKESDIDGLVVDIVEYKYMNFEDIDEEIDMLTYPKPRKMSDEGKLNKIEKSTEIKPSGKIVKTSNKIEEKKIEIVPNIDDDIDGEPI